ncbi:hypothetical protein BDR05DRAFT_681554 [Suillus weaverae]|nr:hypothetical protein BDR05DRAFT_681554 [Suillus weaverae]
MLAPINMVMPNEDARACIPNRDKHTLRQSSHGKIFSELDCVRIFECISIHLQVTINAVLRPGALLQAATSLDCENSSCQGCSCKMLHRHTNCIRIARLSDYQVNLSRRFDHETLVGNWTFNMPWSGQSSLPHASYSISTFLEIGEVSIIQGYGRFKVYPRGYSDHIA